MAERLADIAAQIQNVRQLEAVVTAIRAIAASRAQQGRSLLPGIQAYTEVISGAIGQALNLVPIGELISSRLRATKRGLILFGAEQGFAGLFSERILDAVMPDLEDARIFIVGTRCAAIADERGIRPAWSAPMAAHAGAIAGLTNQIAAALYDNLAIGAVEQFDLVFARSLPGSIEISRHSLLPIDFGRFARPPRAQPPLLTLGPWRLVERLAEEYVFAQLCYAATAVLNANESWSQVRVGGWFGPGAAIVLARWSAKGDSRTATNLNRWRDASFGVSARLLARRPGPAPGQASRVEHEL